MFAAKAFPPPSQCVDLIIPNVTEARQTEKNLRANEATFRGLLQAVPEALLMTDCAGRIVFVNNQTEQSLGYCFEELEDHPIEILPVERFRETSAACRPALGDARRRGIIQQLIELAA